ncbi:MAG: hypothetical protein AB7K08_12405 [Microbacteriaceae bacterium]
MQTMHAHPSTESLATLAPRANRVGLLDRAALHLGVALIKWGRRPAQRTERRVNRAELALLHRDRQLALASLDREGAGIASARLIRIG